MLIYFSKSGRVKEIVSDYALEARDGETLASFHANHGNRAWNVIYAFFEGGLPYPLTLPDITYEMPSGAVFAPADVQSGARIEARILPDEGRDLRFFKEMEWVELYPFPLPSGLITQGKDGLYKATIRQQTSDGRAFAYDLFAFRVDVGAVVKESYIDQSQYEYLNNLVKTFDGRISSAEGKTRHQSADDTGTSFRKDLRVCSGNVYLNEIRACGNADGAISVASSSVDVYKPIALKGGLKPFSVMSADLTKQLASVSEKEALFNVGLSATSVTLLKEATNPTEAVTKRYVDRLIEHLGGYTLNLKNGEANGSIVGGNGNAATPYNLLWGNGLIGSPNPYAVHVGSYNEAKQGVVFSVGTGHVLPSGSEERENTLEVSDHLVTIKGTQHVTELITSREVSASQEVRGVKGSFGTLDVSGQAIVHGDLTVEGKTVSQSVENVTTAKKTIGLAKGNTAPISGYMGLYATKYDGANYGALAWDKDGIAYVGDCSVDEKTGEISDLPSNGLQALLTRDTHISLAEGDLLVWDATGKKAKGLKAPWSDFANLGKANTFLGTQTFRNGLKIGNTGISGGLASSVSLPDKDGKLALQEEATSVVIRRW